MENPNAEESAPLESETVAPASLVAPDETAPPDSPDGGGVDPASLTGEAPAPAAAAPESPPPAPPVGRRGRHPKGCVCGRCNQSKAGGKPPARATPGIAAPDFSDLGLPGNGAAAPADFTDLTQTPGPPPPNYEMMAAITFDMSVNGLALVFGPEWQPQNPTERGAVVGAIKTYYEAQGIKDIPPGMMLAIVVGIYAAPRIQQPTTRGKLSVAWAWCKAKFKKRATLRIVEAAP